MYIDVHSTDMQFAVENALRCLLNTSVKDNAFHFHFSLLLQTYEHLRKVKGFNENQITFQQQLSSGEELASLPESPFHQKNAQSKPTRRKTTERNGKRTNNSTGRAGIVPPTAAHIEWEKIHALYRSLNESYEEIRALLDEGLDLMLHKDIDHLDDSDPLLSDLKRFRTPSRADHIRYAYASQQVYMDCHLSISQHESRSRSSYLKKSSVMKHDIEIGSKLVEFEKILPGSSVIVIQARDKLKSLLQKSIPSFVHYLQQSTPESDQCRLLTLINRGAQSFSSGLEEYRKLNAERRASCQKRKCPEKDYRNQRYNERISSLSAAQKRVKTSANSIPGFRATVLSDINTNSSCGIQRIAIGGTERAPATLLVTQAGLDVLPTMSVESQENDIEEVHSPATDTQLEPSFSATDGTPHEQAQTGIGTGTSPGDDTFSNSDSATTVMIQTRDVRDNGLPSTLSAISRPLEVFELGARSCIPVLNHNLDHFDHFHSDAVPDSFDNFASPTFHVGGIGSLTSTVPVLNHGLDSFPNADPTVPILNSGLDYFNFVSTNPILNRDLDYFNSVSAPLLEQHVRLGFAGVGDGFG